MSRTEYTIQACEVVRIHREAYRAQKISQAEICGVVLTNHLGKLKISLLENQSSHSGKFALHVNQIESCGDSEWHVLGTFHSHPISDAIPGPRDITDAFYKGMELIYDVCGRELHFWKLVGEGIEPLVEEVPIKIVRDSL